MNPAARAKTAIKTKIMLVGDQPVVGREVAELINEEPDLTVCAEADGMAKLAEALRSVTPDVVIADISLGKASGFEIIKWIRDEYLGLPVLALSVHDEAAYAARTLRLGAMGYIMKDHVATNLIGAIHTVLKGKIYLSERMTLAFLRRIAGGQARAAGSPIASLTNSELTVLEMLGQGRDSRRIANDLDLSVKTVESYRAHLKQKLGLRSSTQLIQYAARWMARG
jgi:DNA-binding NarL/FixJ family response regulator